jgi:cation:H+ antiporter
VIFLAAPYLARSAAALAAQLGLAQGFVGSLFLAVTTSLPEAAVTAASIRAGWYNLAVGNLLGSNCFNMAAVVPLDLVDGPGSLLGRVDPTLVVAAVFGILLTAVALLDVLNKSERRIWMVEPGPTLTLGIYVAGVIWMYVAAR